jgi:predicted aspartyl protease
MQNRTSASGRLYHFDQWRRPAPFRVQMLSRATSTTASAFHRFETIAGWVTLPLSNRYGNGILANRARSVWIVHVVKPRSLLAMCLVASLGLAGDAIADGAKCKLAKIVDWPVRMVRNHIVVDGAINGQKVGIALDTGAQISLILRSSAVRLDLPRHEAPGRRIYGIGGESNLEIAIVDAFKIGEALTEGMQLFVAGERDLGEGVDVLLGEDFLRTFDVEFDLAHRAVRLYQSSNCDGVSLAYWTTGVVGEVEIEPIDETRPRIGLTVHVNDRPIDAILDSGASLSVLTKRDAASVGVTPDTPGVVASYSSQGLGARTVGSWIGPFQSFAIGNERIPDVRIRFADLYRQTTYTATGSHVAKNVSRMEPMLLGADFLRAYRTFVAHSQRRIYFTYSGGPVFQVEPAAPPPAARLDGDQGSRTANK